MGYPTPKHYVGVVIALDYTDGDCTVRVFQGAYERGEITVPLPDGEVKPGDRVPVTVEWGTAV